MFVKNDTAFHQKFSVLVEAELKETAEMIYKKCMHFNPYFTQVYSTA